MEIKVKFGQDAGKVLVSEKGTFSLYLPEGSYDVTVEVKASDSLASRGIGFAPVKQVVAVTDSPVADINFQPIKANIGGQHQFYVFCFAQNLHFLCFKIFMHLFLL